MSFYHDLPALLKKWVDGLATGFGLGFLPHAPGTWGTLGALPLIAVMSLSAWLDPLLPWCLYAACCLVGYFVIRLYEQEGEVHDPACVIIDEVLGFTLIFLAVPVGFFSLVSGFIIFRIFDIFKPFPISWVEQRWDRRPIGTLLDDLVAGVLCMPVVVLLQQLRIMWAS